MVVTDGITAQYKHFCEQLGIKANSQVLAQLPSEAAAATFQTLDLSGNCVGSKGAVSVLKLVQNNFPGLRTLSFKGNNLASAVTQDIYNALVRHPSIAAVDLSGNDIRLGGPALVDLVKRNKNIVELNIEGTFLRPLFERLIALHLKRNQELAAANPAPAAAAGAAAAPAATSSAGAAAAAAAVPSMRTRGGISMAAPEDEDSSSSSAAAPAVVPMGRQRRGVQMAAPEDEQPKRSPRKAMFADADDGSADGGSGGSGSPDNASGNGGNGGDAPFSADGGGGGFGGFAFGDEAADADHQNADPNEIDDMMHVSFANATDGKKVVRRATVSSEVYRDDEIENFQPQQNEHEPEVRAFLFKTLEQHDLFSHLEDFELYVAVDAMDLYERGEGDHLFEEGDDDCDSFFVVYKGALEISRNEKVLKVAKAGDCVNDTMLLYPGQATETAKVLEDESHFYTLDRKTYRCVLAKASKKKRAMYEGFLSSISFLKGLEKQELLSLADALKPAVYPQGEKLIRYGSKGEHFFIIVEGEVAVYGRDDEGKEKYVCEFGVGACVGELEFIHNHLCVADVVAKTETCRVAKMNRRHFEMVMGPVKDVLARTAAESEVYEYYRGAQKAAEEEAS